MTTITIATVLAPQPGQHTVELNASGHASLPNVRDEYEAKHEAAIVAWAIAEGYDFVSTTSWVHRWNNHGCKPDVVANTSGLTVWKREGQAPKEDPIDIWGPYC